MTAVSANSDALDPIAKHARYVDPSHVKLLGILGYGRVYTRAQGVWLWDQKGNRYLDLLAGFGSMNIGHNHPKLVAKLNQFLGSEPPNLCLFGISPYAGDLGERLAKLAGEPLQHTIYTTSGAEAVEAALKLARIATGRPEFIHAKGGFHGLTLGALSVMGNPRTRKLVEPLMPGCHEIPFGDLPSLERELARKKAAAFLVEPIQCEGGIALPPPGYLKAAAELCRRAGTLLLLDEVQVGIGRTGNMFAFQAEGFVPDVLILAKAIGGGLVPIGAAMTSAEVFERAYGSLDTYGVNASTFAGNAMACAAAMATLDILEEEGLLANAAARGEQLLQGLARELASHPMVRAVRGRGLIVGIELGPTDKGILNRLAPWLVSKASRSMFGHLAALRLLERGFVTLPTGHEGNVVRIEPPLTISESEVASVVQAVGAVLADYQSLAPMIKDTTWRIGQQFRSGWSID
jgi:putrescine aminotransferase